MPNTKSAERRTANISLKSLKIGKVAYPFAQLEKKYAELLGAGKPGYRGRDLPRVSSTLGQGGENGRDPPAARQPLQIPLEFPCVCPPPPWPPSNFHSQ